MLENNAWTNDPKKADAMARALRDWAVERGATSSADFALLLRVV